MLKAWIALSFVGSVLLAVADFFFFKVDPSVAFYVHNGAAFLVGLGIFACSYGCFRKKPALNMLAAGVIIGLGMMSIHAVKLLLGKCF